MEVFFIDEVAKYLRCSVSNIRKQVRNNELPYFRNGNRLCFRKEAIDNWVRQQENKCFNKGEYDYD